MESESVLRRTKRRELDGISGSEKKNDETINKCKKEKSERVLL